MSGFGRRSQLASSRQHGVIPPTTGFKYITAVDSSGRYLVDQDDAPILVKGDSPWSMFSNLSPAEVEIWAANRESHGVNAAIVAMIGAEANGGPNANGATYDGILPFVGGDVTNWNEPFWSRLDSQLMILRDHGITALAYPIDGWTTLSGGAFHNKSGPACYTYGQMIANRYPKASYPNIVWMVGGDYNGYDSTTNTEFMNFLSGIRSTGDTRLFSAQFNNETLSTDIASYESSVQWNFAYTYTTTYQKILRGYNRSPSSRDPRPVLFGEGNYEREDNYGGPPTTDETLRRQQLWTLTSGGAGDFTGSEDWQFLTGWQGRLDTVWISQMQKNRDLFESLNWQDLVPDDSSPIVTAGRGTKITNDGSLDVLSNNYVTAAQAPDKSETIVYVPTNTGNTNPRTITLDLARLPAGYTANWVDPTNANSSQAATIDGSGQVTTPGLHSDGTRDWLLLITA